ncbi:MAG: hypothetical protein R6V53_03365 [Candidatus Woesearchaeota archaeon]
MKAQINSQMVKMIAILLTVVVMLAFINGFTGEASRKEQIELCKFSILAASNTKLLGDKTAIDFDCPRYELEIEKSDVEKKGKIIKSDIARLMAEEARICNYMTGEGNLNPFRQDRFSDSTACLICAEIKFEDSLAEEVDEIELGEYLESTRMCDNCTTYADYLTKSAKSEGFKYKETIDLDREYYLLYGYDSAGRWVDPNNNLGKVGDFLTSWALDNDEYALIDFILPEELDDYGCSFLAN